MPIAASLPPGRNNNNYKPGQFGLSRHEQDGDNLMQTSTLRVLIFAFALAITGAPPAMAADAPANDAPIAATIGADGVQRATLVLDSYSYSPSHLIVEVNRPVELTLTSVSSFAPHNLVIDDPASGLAIRHDVGSGSTSQLSFTPTHVGTFPFFCDKKAPFMASHRKKGMEGTLEVREPAS
jgi:heme/copper-type cytochrome/quinol oxidase subunit 2